MDRETADRLEKLGLVNGCGSSGGINFTLTFRKLAELPYFDLEKYRKLEEELDLICDDHDSDYNEGGTWFDRLLADLRLWRRFRDRVKWVKDWKIRIGLPLLAFLAVRFCGASTYNFIYSVSYHYD